MPADTRRALTQDEALRRIEEIGIVPVIRAENVDQALMAIEALYRGGISIAEITMTVPDAPRAIESAIERYGESVLVGAGTVTTVDQAKRCIDAGARFLVSPGLSVAVVRAARAADLLAIPGAFTPTELMNCIAEDIRVVKVFPCGSGGGVQHIKALRGPFPDIALIPTGSVNSSNAGQYIAAGAFALGAGSDLVDNAALRAGNLAKITRAAEDFVVAVTAAREACARQSKH